jgi:hypothetical protein
MNRFLSIALLALFVSGPALGQPHANTQANNASQPEADDSKPDLGPSPITSDDAKGGSGHKEEKCHYDGPKWFAGFYCFFAGHEKFWVSFGTLVLAAFTTILGAATIFLARATNRLVSGADSTAQRQLRAYVMADIGDIRLRENHALETMIYLKNFGQTPAYDVKSWVDMRVGNPNNPPFAQRLPFEQITMIGPGSKFIIGPDRISISAEVPNQIKNGTKVIFVWGETSYRDAFGHRWVYRYCTRNSKIMMNIADELGTIAPGWALSPYPGLGYQEHEAEDEG